MVIHEVTFWEEMKDDNFLMFNFGKYKFTSCHKNKF